MSRIAWTLDGEQGLLRIRGVDDATRVDAAVQRFAATFDGDVHRRKIDPANVVWLLVPPYAVKLALDPLDDVVTVLAVYSRWPEEPDQDDDPGEYEP